MYQLMVNKEGFIQKKEDIQRAARINIKMIDNSDKVIWDIAAQTLAKLYDWFQTTVEPLFSDLSQVKKQKVFSLSQVA